MYPQFTKFFPNYPIDNRWIYLEQTRILPSQSMGRQGRRTPDRTYHKNDSLY